MALLPLLLAVILGFFAALGVISDHLLPRLLPSLADEVDLPAYGDRAPPEPPQEFALSG